MAVDGLISGSSPRKAAPSGRSRRLTIQEGNHPCAEDRRSRLRSPCDKQKTVTGSYSGRRPETRAGESYTREGRKGSYPGDPVEHTGVSFLSVPQSPLRRPSTADVMIEKLHVERNEGGGLSISGVALSAHCHLTLIICGTFCMLAGIVLTYVAFVNANPSAMAASTSPINLVHTTTNVPASLVRANATEPASTEGSPAGTGTASTGEAGNSSINGTLKTGATSSPTENPVKNPAANQNQNLTVVGPVCIVTGLVMIIVGLSLLALGRKIQRDEKEQRRLQSEAQLDQLHRSFSVPRGTPLTTNVLSGPDQSYPIMSLRRGSFWMDTGSRDICSPLSPPPYVTEGAASPRPPSGSPTPSSPRSILSSRASSPMQGGRVSVARSPFPSWGGAERMDVGSFPPDAMEPPSKMRRVAHTPDQAKTVSDKKSCPPAATHQPATDHTPDILNLEEDSGPPDQEGQEEGGHESTEDNIDLNAMFGRPPDYETVQEEMRRERTSKVERPASRSGSIKTQSFRRLSESSTLSVDCIEHNLPYQVPMIHITPSAGPSPPPLSSMPHLPRLSRHSTDSRGSSASRPVTAANSQ